jgi:hypothetical protein
LKDAVGSAGTPEHILDGEGALRNVRRVLEKPDIPGHERRRRESKDLPEGKIPWHDRQDDAERLVEHEALSVLGANLAA